MQPALWARIGLIAVVVVAVSSMAHAKDKRELVVMTQNLYLGSSLDAAIGIDPEDPDAAQKFIIAVANIYATVIFTDFPARAQAIADQIETYEPDIIGLQEVSLWTAIGDTEGRAGGYDFLEILLEETELGESYEVAAVSQNAEIGTDLPGLPGIPLAPPVCKGQLFECFVTLVDRDVILVKKNNPNLEVFNPQDGNYERQVVLNTPVGPLSFNRGWASVDGTFEGKKFTFVNTHLEIGGPGGFADAQEAQGQEFLAGPAKRGGAVIAVGDFNSRADGSSTTTYADLTMSYFDDAWDDPNDPGFTCCFDEFLADPNSTLSSAIDFVFTHAPVRALRVDVIGDAPFQGMPPLFPSDHAGVVAELRIH
jgi:endonuclease/exonuclease/phosphatase family metal-dependent hydrolase